MDFSLIGLEGALVINNFHFEDERGCFDKLYSQDVFKEKGLDLTFKEFFYSTSHLGVIRGMHFHKPPMDHGKLVFVSLGKILDVILDIRVGSETYGEFYSIELSSRNHLSLYIPSGFAHGFLSLEDNTVVNYLQTNIYSSECDLGVKYDSFGYDWPMNNHKVSDKDRSLPLFKDLPNYFI